MLKIKKIVRHIRPGVAVALSNSGIKFIKKSWNIKKSIKNKLYLDNEIKTYLLLNSIKVNKYIKIPKLLGYKKGFYSSEIQIGKIKGTDLKKLSSIKKVEVYLKIVKSLSLLNKFITKNYIKSRPQNLLIMQFRSYFVYMMAIFKNIKLAKHISKIYFKHIKLSKFNYKKRSLYFCHKDISDSNIISLGSTNVLIDFGISHFSDKIVDIAGIIYYHINDYKFINRFSNSSDVKKYFNKEDKEILKSYMYYLLIFDYATGVKKSKSELDRTLRQLRQFEI